MANLSQTIIASRLGPARPRGIAWCGAGGWVMASQARQLNFSRTVCTTFHCLGTTSSVSVTSSPSLTRSPPPQQEQASGEGSTTRSRGRSAGSGARLGLRRVKARTVVSPSSASPWLAFSPEACPCCGGAALVKLGEDVTETLELVPRQWKVVQTVREKFSCRACEAITQPPAPHHAIPRGRAGPGLLATILNDKFAMHLPLTRQSRAMAAEGIKIDVSTLADWVGAACVTLRPLHDTIRTHVLAAERLHGDDTTVPVLARKKTVTGRLWTYVRDDRPFGGVDPPAALFFYSRDRSGAHAREHLAEWSGILQADAFAGFNALYARGRAPAPIQEAACWAHARRKFFELADVAKALKAPLAIEAVRRIDRIFKAEREINGETAEVRLKRRRDDIRPLVDDLAAWMQAERPKLARANAVAGAMDYMLKRWPTFTRFLADGRICLTNNAAERAMRGIAIGRRNWTFAGSDRGGQRAAAVYTLIETARLNDVDPRAWIADVLARINDHPASRLDQLLPWNWKAENQTDIAA